MPIVAILFLVGVFYAVREAGKETGRAIGKRRASPPSRNAAAATRQRRQETAGWWAGEARRGFPTTRHGFRTGWNDHKLAAKQRERDRAKQGADHELQHLTLDQEITAHNHRMQVAARQRQQQPTMSQQLAAVPPQQFRQPLGDPIEDDPPLADGHTAGAGPPPSTNGHSPRGSAPASPSTNGRSAGGFTVSDVTYDTSKEAAEALAVKADTSVHENDLNEVQALGDGLQAMIGSDSTALGLVGDIHTDLQDIRDANARLQEHSIALKDHIESTYGTTQESVDASGQEAPEKEFLSH
ncbi:MAG TPA: hypothetical protein VEV45_20860 [Streptosporangiaceae bacterium]|nr:hypothetical protein [Streptosporangiaceae bacterium]